jgi:predicted SnoaL-like aldol condensation-catalyzing enzyme
MDALIRQAFALADARAWDRLEEVFAPGLVDHMGGSTATGLEAFVAAVTPFYEMVPGLRHEVFDVCQLDDELVLFTVRAEGPGLDVVVANAVRVVDGRVHEHWGPGEQAMGTIMQQLGIAAAT